MALAGAVDAARTAAAPAAANATKIDFVRMAHTSQVQLFLPIPRVVRRESTTAANAGKAAAARSLKRLNLAEKILRSPEFLDFPETYAIVERCSRAHAFDA